MSEQEYVRKYMLKDIFKRNMRFWWLIVICVAVFAGGLGYKKYNEYQKRFAKIELKGTVKQYSVDYYSGNVNGESLLMRTQTLIAVMTSRETYSELVKLSGYPLTYDTFVELVICDNDGTKDSVTARMQYPFGSDEYSIVEDSDAESFMGYYVQAVKNTCDRILGENVVYELGRSDRSSVTYTASDEQKQAANKAVIKNAFIGGVIGLIIPVVIITLIYLLGGKLRTAAEIAFCAGLRLLADVKEDDCSQLEQAELYLEHRYGLNGININLIHIGDGGEYISDKLKESFKNAGYKADVTLTDTNAADVNAGAYRAAMKADASILVAGAGRLREQDIENVVSTMALYDIEGSGVIVYEPHR